MGKFLGVVVVEADWVLFEAVLLLLVALPVGRAILEVIVTFIVRVISEIDLSGPMLNVVVRD